MSYGISARPDGDFGGSWTFVSGRRRKLEHEEAHLRQIGADDGVGPERRAVDEELDLRDLGMGRSEFDDVLRTALSSVQIDAPVEAGWAATRTRQRRRRRKWLVGGSIVSLLGLGVVGDREDATTPAPPLVGSSGPPLVDGPIDADGVFEVVRRGDISLTAGVSTGELTLTLEHRNQAAPSAVQLDPDRPDGRRSSGRSLRWERRGGTAARSGCGHGFEARAGWSPMTRDAARTSPGTLARTAP